MKNIHLIPTDNEQHSIIQKNDGLLLIQTPRKEYSGKKLNLYITSSEDIKEGDWFLDITDNTLWKNQVNEGMSKTLFPECKKIILTTDQKLIDDGVQEIEDYFLQWFVENPSCEFVEVNKKLLEFPLTFKMMYKIIIPQDETGKYFADNADVIITMERPKVGTHYHFIIQNDKYKMLLAMQTYPETKYYFKDDEISVEELILKLDNGESSEIKYSEDEVRELLIKGLTHNDDKLCGSLVTVQKEIRTANFNVWFEENKKK